MLCVPTCAGLEQRNAQLWPAEYGGVCGRVTDFTPKIKYEQNTT